MSYTIADCYPGIRANLTGRTVPTATMDLACKKTILELTEDYKHPLLEETGPTVQFIAFQNVYAPSYFLQAADATLDISKVNSFWLYNDPYVPPSPTNSVTNAGYDLVFRSIKDIEVLLNIPGLPLFWSRNNNQLYFGSMPDNSYSCYMRYQHEHAFDATLANTVIKMANSWQEIVEYGAALRIATQLNLADKKNELHASLYGDKQFQQSGGIEGAPGLIFQRTSQRNRDQQTTTRRFRLRMGSV